MISNSNKSSVQVLPSFPLGKIDDLSRRVKTLEDAPGGGGSGDVVGPASATDNAIARYDATTGKLIQDSGITIADGTTGTLSNTNTGDQLMFGTIAVAGQSDIDPASTGDTLTFVAGTNITLTTNAGTKELTINSTGGGGGGSFTLTTAEVNVGSTARRSGHFTITTSGLTSGKAVSIQQAVGPYTGKGTLADEAEMDGITVSASTTSTTEIKAYWTSRTAVRGNFKFNYVVSA